MKSGWMDIAMRACAALAVGVVVPAACTSIAIADVAPPRDIAYPGTLQLTVDATDLDHRIFRVHEEIPVEAGALTLLYPRWLPGDHAPDGPIGKLAGLAISGNGRPVVWQRDTVDVYAFHVDVPPGVANLALDFQFLSPRDSSEGGVTMMPDMLDLQWNAVALYPAGHYSRQITVAACVKLPHGWRFATALDRTDGSDSNIAGADDAVRFKPVGFNTLIDSPLMAGRHFKRFNLAAAGEAPVYLDLFADDARNLEATPKQIALHRNLVTQARKLYASRHYDHYDFLFDLSDQFDDMGLEHHRSSEDGADPEYFTAWDQQAPGRDLLAHEYTHSWNGKFRRPADLWTPNFNVPMRDSLLWVYEGQTQYWGFVLTARAGLWNAQQARDAIAQVAATYAGNRPGFSWRNVQDTTNDPIIGCRGSAPYRSYQLCEDYYNAGLLIWLAVDAKLRGLSHGKRSLDDFARAFFGIDDGSYVTKTYTFDDVVNTLNGVVAHDWAGFLRERLDAHAPPLDGLAASGWKLVYTDAPSAYQKDSETNANSLDYSASLGIIVNSKDNTISDVRWNGPAFKAGLAPTSKLVAVDGRAFTAERLKDAIADAKSGSTAIALLVRSGDEYRTVAIDYHGGLKYPHLERIAGTPDRLGAILAPRR